MQIKTRNRTMEFSLQVSPPSIASTPDPDDDCIGDIIETLCSVDSDVIMVWDDFPFRLSWDYVIADIWNDILLMLRSINQGVESFTIHWPCQAFFCRWEFRLKDTTMTIDAHWLSVCGRVEDQLRQKKHQIEISIIAFVEEWRALLSIVREILSKAGYSPNSLFGFAALVHELECSTTNDRIRSRDPYETENRMSGPPI